jgi:ubiquinone biosynthesis protein
LALKRTPFKHINHLSRYREIANVLIKYGFGFVLSRASRFSFRKTSPEAIEEQLSASSAPRRLRLALEELGATFIKLGQLLSTRPDFLGPEYIKELEKLQNQVPPFPFEIVQQILAEDGIAKESFACLNPEPIAAGSIAQVHEAVLQSGQNVVLKICRPGIEQLVTNDLEILKELSRVLEKRTSWGRLYKISLIVDELAEALNNELDFRKEARNADIFYNNFKKDPTVLIPRVIWEYSSQRVLCLEKIDGVKISDFINLKKNNYDTERIARHLIGALFKQVYEHGFFHADPHPGNIAITEGERVILYDFGQVGTVDDITKEKGLRLLISMIRYDSTGVTRALLNIGIGSQHVNQEELRRDVSRLQQKYYGMPLSEINLGVALAELLELSVKYQMRVPAELSLMGKMFMTLESILSQLDPQLSIIDIAEPYGRRIVRERFSPRRFKKELEEVSLDYVTLIHDLPRSIDNILKIIEDGELKIRMEHSNLKKIAARLDIVSNRISLAIIIASIIVGTSLIVDSSHQYFFSTIPLVEIGFVSAMVFGLFLVYSIIRSGKY